MATFLTTKDIVGHLHRIIEQAAGELILISPYIDADDETMNRLRDKAGSTAIHVVYRYKKSTRRPNLDPDDRAFFDSIGARVSSLKDLHTKCYLNQKEALVTSMNLYRYSQDNNDEMGILVSKQDDSVLYEAIYREANRLKVATGEPSTASSGSVKPKKAETRTKTTADAGTLPRRGFCIRCGDDVAVRTKVKPYCRDCYDEYEDEDYEDVEDFCHTCGHDWGTTLFKPLCRSCFKEYGDLFEFITP